ncbi:MAG: hypothetical protein H6722_14325 [Sandaracinus sp.]|nr:hypothetical protein [Sandaracinus sp.]
MLRFAWVSLVILAACSTSTVGEPIPDGGRATGVCRGVATPCWDLESGVECLEQQGCGAELGCVSEAPGCSALGRSNCTIQPSCRWEDSFSRCTVDETQCTPIDARESCEGTTGCRWDLGCRGAVVACEDLAAGECEAQVGCVLEAR